MCGIVGMIAPDATSKWRFNTLRNLLLRSVHRGRDATGIAFIDPETGRLHVLKNGVEAKEFVSSPEFKALENQIPPVVIGHNRAGSKYQKGGQLISSADNNENNHPFFSEHSDICMIHNGQVDDAMWADTAGKKHGILHAPIGSTDSEIILRVVETFAIKQGGDLLDNIENMCFNIDGDYTTAFIRESEPESIWFTRRGRTLFVAYVPFNNAFVFASEDDIITKALRTEKFVYDFFSTSELPSGLIINQIDDKIIFKASMVPGEGRLKKFKYGLDFDCRFPDEWATGAYKWHHKLAEMLEKADEDRAEAEGKELDVEEEGEVIPFGFLASGREN